MDVSTQNFFERRIKPILLYVGTIGAILASIAYVALVCILIFGFMAHNLTQTIVFAIINAVVGLIIMQFLKVQGQDFAKNLPQNKPILDEYYKAKTRDKKFHSMTYYWIRTGITDTFSKGLSILFTTIGIIYIVVQGSQDYTLLIMGFVNLIMFFCFGLIALSQTYDFFNNQHMAYVQEQLRIYHEKENQKNVCEIPQEIPEGKEETSSNLQTENEKAMEMVAGPPHQQGYVPGDTDRRSPVLEPIDNNRSNGYNNQSVLLGSIRQHLDSVGSGASRDTDTISIHFYDPQNTTIYDKEKTQWQ